MKLILPLVPGVGLYLVFLVLVLVLALWERETDPPAGKPRATVLKHGPRIAGTSVTVGRNFDQGPLRAFAWQPRRDHRPFLHLEATLSAFYAAKVDQALRTIRVGAHGYRLQREGTC